MPARTAAAALILSLALTGAAAAGDAPEIARVAGLPAGDSLTLRVAPSAASLALGTLAEGAGPLEILETTTTGRTGWAMIATPEGSAWVARRYLTPVDPPRIGATALREGMLCHGTEPFWSLALTGADRAVWRDPHSGEETTAGITGAVTAEARGAWPLALTLAAEGVEAVMTVSADRCSDGMSDRVYGWRALLLERGVAHPRLFEGCCGFPPP